MAKSTLYQLQLYHVSFICLQEFHKNDASDPKTYYTSVCLFCPLFISLKAGDWDYFGILLCLSYWQDWEFKLLETSASHLLLRHWDCISHEQLTDSGQCKAQKLNMTPSIWAGFLSVTGSSFEWSSEFILRFLGLYFPVFQVEILFSVILCLKPLRWYRNYSLVYVGLLLPS